MRDRQASGEGAVLRAAASIRELVMRRELLPGQQLRQEDLAQQIGISRGPFVRPCRSWALMVWSSTNATGDTSWLSSARMR